MTKVGNTPIWETLYILYWKSLVSNSRQMRAKELVFMSERNLSKYILIITAAEYLCDMI